MRTKLMILGLALCLAATAQATEDLERQAAEAVAAHQLVEARALYRQLAASDPENVEYQVWIGRLSSWLNDYPSAEATFDSVLARDGANVEALVGKAYVAMWQEQYPQAHALLRRAAEAAPASPDVELALARNYHFQGKDREAAEHVDRVLADDPGSPEAQELKRRLAPAPAPRGFFARLKRFFTGHS